MPKLSRRTLVTRVASLPALALPGAAMAADNPDAELLQLGEELAVLEQERAAMMAIDRQHSALVHAEVERRTGIARCDAPDYGAKDHDAYWAISTQVANELSGPNPDDEDENGATRWDRFNDRQFPILGAILESRAATQEGLKIQARAVSIAASDNWEGISTDSHEKDFIESVCAFFGMDAEAIALGRDQQGAVQS
jgi:hypothetical protein